MKNINLYITYQGVHGLIDDEIMSNKNAQPKSKLYENISLPRLQNNLTDNIDSTLSNLFAIDNDRDTYHIGFFYDALKGESFKKLLDLCPSGTKIIFAKTDEATHNAYFRHFLNEMTSLGRVEIFSRPFKKEKFTDFDIKIVHEEGRTYVDDIADDFDASDWKLFDANGKLLIREFIKP
jgi:hypothetical protein